MTEKDKRNKLQGEIIMAVKEVNFLNSFGQIAQEALNSISNSFSTTLSPRPSRHFHFVDIYHCDSFRF